VSEILAGDVVARLRADVSQFNQAIADVLQRLNQLSQATTQFRATQTQSQSAITNLSAAMLALQQAITRLTQAQTQSTTQQTQGQQSSRQLAAAYLALAQSIAQQTQAYSQMTQAVTQATQAITQSTSSLRTQQTVLQQTTQATGAASSGLKAMLTIAGGIGVATGIGAIAGQLKDLAVQTVQVGTRMESLRASLSALGGGAAVGAAQFQTLLSMAQQLGVAFEPLARGFVKLTAAATQAGLPLADQLRLLEAVTKEARRTGASNEDLGRAITALSQTASKGKVSMEELRQQFGEALPTGLAATAKGMGITTEALNKLVESGTLDFVPFVKAVTRGFEDMQATGGKFVDGTQQAFNRLKNAWIELQDTIMKGGLNTYLIAVIANIREAVEWTNKKLQPTPSVQGPTPEGLEGVTADQTKEITRLQRLIALYESQLTSSTSPTMRAQREAQIAAAKEQLQQIRDAILENTNATAGQEKAQAKVTQETNATKHAQEQQEENLKSLRQALDKIRKEDDAYRAKAADAPNVYGDPKGTAAQQETFAKKRQQELEASVKAATELRRSFPATTVVPPDMVKELRDRDSEYKKYGDTIDAIQKKEQDLAKAEREKEAAAKRAAAAREAEAKAAVTQAIQLDATRERLEGLTRRPTENKAEEAASRVRAQYAGAVAEAEKMIVALERSKALQAQRPEALEQFKALRDALREAGEAQAKLASEEVLTQQMAPLAELAVKYGAVTAEIISQRAHVQELASTYNLAAQQVRDLAKAEELATQFKGTPLEDAAEQKRVAVETGVIYQAEIELLKERFTALKQNADAMRTAEDAQAAFTQRIKDNLEQLQTPREERAEARLRAQARRQHVALTPENEALLQQITAQERWNDIMGVTEQIGDRAAQSITDGLLSIIDGTKSVSEAFKLMAKNILDSIAQIVMHETFKRLIGLGIGLLGSAFAPTIAPEGGASAGGGGFELLFGGTASSGMRAQGGAIVNRPTTILAGENPSMNPEYVVNSPQMKALMGAAMRAAPSAGGQAAGGDVAVILVDNRGQAEREAAAQRGMGRQVIIQEVVRDLSQGSGSTIGRMIRAGGH
jgi:tape measure domain-containing protein